MGLKQKTFSSFFSSKVLGFSLFFLLICFLSFFLGTFALTKNEERTLFQQCIDQKRSACFQACPEKTPPHKLYDYWSEKLLGHKTIRRKPYPPCQAKCFSSSHLDCTEENFKKGGIQTFKLYERWPLKSWGIIEEPFSMFLCLFSALGNLFLLTRYLKATTSFSSEKYPFRGVYIGYYVFWIFTFSCATLFHLKDTQLTERMDYYSAFIAVWYTCWLGIIRSFWLNSNSQRVILAVPFLLYAVYHLYYMNFVSFDYGYNMTIIIITNVFNSILWIGAALKEKIPHLRMNLTLQLGMWSMSLFEIYDFPPFFGYFDPHGLWHFGILVGSIFYLQYLIIDANWIYSLPLKQKNT